MSDPILKQSTTVPSFYKVGFIAMSVATSLLFFALIFSLFYNLNYFFSANPNNSRLTVEASSTSQVVSNNAKATLVVVRRGQDSNQVNTDLDEATKQVIQTLVDNGISKEDIETNKNVYQDYAVYSPDITTNQDQKAPSYVGNLNVSINFKNLKNGDTKPNEIIEKLNSVQDMQFSGFEYSIENKEEICNKLEEEALSKAFEKGEKQVKAVNGKRVIKTNVVSVTSCNSQIFPYYSQPYLGMSENSIATESAPILPSKNELNATATVEFEYSL